MLKITINTHYPEEPASLFYINALKLSNKFEFNNFSDYNNFDIALFMTYDRDLEEMRLAKRKNPNLKTGVIDPRGLKQIQGCITDIDFFVVDSIEMADFYQDLGKPIFKYLEYPLVKLCTPNHIKKEKTVIAYHGNMLHLLAMNPAVTWALDELSHSHEIEFWAIYNIKTQGYLKHGMPKRCSTRHIQWHEKVYEEELPAVDIGVVPSMMPIPLPVSARKKIGTFGRFFNESSDDYLLRFKMPSNAGRTVVFALLGIPVVSDFLPSNMMLLRDGHNGLIANGAGSWYKALCLLTEKPATRQAFAERLQEEVRENLSFEVQNERLFADITNLSTIPEMPRFDKSGYYKSIIYTPRFKLWALKKRIVRILLQLLARLRKR